MGDLQGRHRRRDVEVNIRFLPTLCVLELCPPQTSKQLSIPHHTWINHNPNANHCEIISYLQPWQTRTRDSPSAANADTSSSRRHRRSRSEWHAAIARLVENSQPHSLVPRFTFLPARCFLYRPISSRSSPSSPIQPTAATRCTATSAPSAEFAFSMLACSPMAACALPSLSRAELSILGWIGRR